MRWPSIRTVRIRDAGAHDLEAVRALLVTTWHATYDDLLGADRVRQITSEWHSPERLGGQVGQPGTAFLIAIRGRQIAGTGFAHMTGPDEAEIGRLYVLPALQGRSIGALLLEALIGRLETARRFRLEVEPRNQSAIRFYERNGFLPAGMTQNCGADGSAWQALLMQRQVDRLP